MQETLNFFTNPQFPPKEKHISPSISRHKRNHLHFPSLLSSKTATISLPPPPSKPPPLTESPSQNRHHHKEFKQKMLYLDTIGLDFVSIIANHPRIVSSSLQNIKSIVDFISSNGFTSPELRRICGMCPEILTYKLSDVISVITFLFREARVCGGSELRLVINRRPRLLACSVVTRLRPTLYFLQSIGLTEVNRHTYLLSCSVEEKLLPRIDYLQKIGFAHRDAVTMVRRFPQLFCYSIENNFEPKFDYFVVEMGRELKELKEFPQYSSFSLENRIMPRYRCCVERGVCFPLRVLLKTNNVQFQERLDVCYNSSTPLRSSPLWCTDCVSESIWRSRLFISFTYLYSSMLHACLSVFLRLVGYFEGADERGG